MNCGQSNLEPEPAIPHFKRKVWENAVRNAKGDDFRETMVLILISGQKFSTTIKRDICYPPGEYGLAFEKRLLDFET